MPTVTGIFNSQDFASKVKKDSFASMIVQLMPNGTAPLFALTGMTDSVTAAQPEHGFFTKTMIFPMFTLTANVTAVATTFTVATTDQLIAGQVHRLEQTGENIAILSVLSATTIQVARAVGSTAAAAVNISTQNPRAYQVGTAYEEGSIRPNAMAINPVPVTNYTQIFRNTWAVTGTAAATQVNIGEGKVSESRQDCAKLHATDIEKAMLFGQKYIGIRNSQPYRTMDGVLSIVGNLAYYPSSYTVPNVYTASSTTNYTQLETMLDPMFNQTTDPRVANERLMFVGGQARVVLNQIGRLNGQYQLVDGQTGFGLQFSTFKTARGTFTMIEHPLLNSNPDWRKMAIAIDPAGIKQAYLGDRRTQNREFNISGQPVDQGIDAVGGTLTTEMTIELHNPPANAVIFNLTAGAAG